MLQFIAICFLAGWAGFGAYIYKTDYARTKYWHPDQVNFWISVFVRSLGYMLGLSVASIIVLAVVGTAVGLIH